MLKRRVTIVAVTLSILALGAVFFVLSNGLVAYIKP